MWQPRVTLALALLAGAGCADAILDPGDPQPSWTTVDEWAGGPAWVQLETEPFTVGETWRVRWEGAGDGALFVWLHRADGTLVSQVTDQQGSGDGAVERVGPATTYYLRITSTMWAWSVALETRD